MTTILIAILSTTLQGDTLILPMTESQCRVGATVFEKTYECRPDNSILVGIDLVQKPGSYPVCAGEQSIGSIVVHGRAFRTRHFYAPSRITKKRDAELEKQIEDERRKVAVAFTSGLAHAPRFPAGIEFLIPPRSSEQTGQFGDRRFYGKKFSQHRGVDLLTPFGTPISTASYGVVVLADTFPVGGTTVIIYHGSGIYSAYLHLSKSFVQQGQVINSGEVIGHSGASGAVSGSHLHFGIHVNGAVVDPIRFIDTFNRSLYTED